MNEIINITKSAEEYLAKLLNEKGETDLSVRIFISDPGTPKAETCLAYCKPDEAQPDDVIINLELINVNVEKKSIPFLESAEVNFDNENINRSINISSSVIDFEDNNINNNIVYNPPNVKRQFGFNSEI